MTEQLDLFPKKRFPSYPDSVQDAMAAVMDANEEWRERDRKSREAYNAAFKPRERFWGKRVTDGTRTGIVKVNAAIVGWLGVVWDGSEDKSPIAFDPADVELAPPEPVRRMRIKRCGHPWECDCEFDLDRENGLTGSKFIRDWEIADENERMDKQIPTIPTSR